MPALVVVAVAAGTGRVGGALAAYADGRITPRLMTEADIALVTAVCRVESAAYGEAGFADRQEAAEVGATRTRFMVQDAQRFLAAAIRMVTAGGVITALHWTMLPLLLLAVLPAGVGAVLALLLFRMEFSIIALIGVFLLIGIVKKNAILIIDFALESERARGLSAMEAVREACMLRFRPILMTTLAAALGALLGLAVATIHQRGRGSERRADLPDRHPSTEELEPPR